MRCSRATPSRRAASAIAPKKEPASTRTRAGTSREASVGRTPAKTSAASATTPIARANQAPARYGGRGVIVPAGSGSLSTGGAGRDGGIGISLFGLVAGKAFNRHPDAGGSTPGKETFADHACQMLDKI